MRRKQTLLFGIVLFMAACILGVMVKTNRPRQFTVEDDAMANTGIIQATPTSSTPPASVEKININTATAAELEQLDGVGEKIAERIIRYRQENGAFSVIEDIMRVSGIGAKKFEKIKNDICVE